MSQVEHVGVAGTAAADPSRDPHSSTAPTSSSGSAPVGAADSARLVVPEGLRIDEVTRYRLQRLLSLAPPEIDGVVAQLEELPPGVSCRVHAEWRSLERHSLLEALSPTSSPVRGAVLLRAGVGFSVAGDLVEVPGSALVADAGAVVHNPRSPFRSPETASDLGRPPFPRRPVVVLLALGRDARLAEWARRMANGLLRRDVEARIALPEPAEGLNLTCPCLPCEESIRALAPDVVVALDSDAAGHAQHWCGTHRSTVVVELADELAGTIALVPWQINRAQGRLRARISRAVDPLLLASLVVRLCAGPHPEPPAEDVEIAERKPATNRNIPTVTPRPGTLVLTGPLDPDASARMDGLVDSLAAEGMKVLVAPVDKTIANASGTVPLLVLAGVAGIAGIGDLLADRNDKRLATVLDVGPFDLIRGETRHSASPSFAQDVTKLALECGMVSAPAGAPHQAALGLGIRTLLLPTMLTRERVAALRSARAARRDTDEIVVGWRLRSVGQTMPSYVDAAADAVAQLLDDEPRFRVHVQTDAGRLPARLRRHDRVLVEHAVPEPEVLSAWTVQLFTPLVVGEYVADDLRYFLEASFAGVPSVLPTTARHAIDGHPSPQLVVRDAQDPQDWLAVLWSVLGDGRRLNRRVVEALGHAVSVSGSAASRTIANRFAGWALYQGSG